MIFYMEILFKKSLGYDNRDEINCQELIIRVLAVYFSVIGCSHTY